MAREQEDSRREKGIVIVLTGEGKGKTTSALGIALRAVGGGLRVLMIQFIKGTIATGEMESAKRLAPEFELRRFGAGFIYLGKGPTEKDFAAAREGIEFARQALHSGKYDLLILDEVNNAIKLGLFGAQEVADLVKGRPRHVHMVLTGRDAPRELIHLADTVTEMKSIKHPHETGRPAIRGIEC
jgi:cob(I)alamin adenosyltransferase